MVLLVALLLVSLIPVQAQDDVTLRYFMWDPSFEETEQQMVEICEAELGISVELETLGTPDYWTRMQAMAAADDLPDVFSMSSGFVEEWTRDGLVMNIQEYVDRDIMPAADEYFTGAFDVARDDNGDMYAFPFALVETVLFYNQDAFDEAGLEYPTSEWTWDDFRAAAEALTVDADEDGLIDQYGHWFYGRYAQIEPWIFQNNGGFFNEDGTFELDTNAVEALEFLNGLIEDGVAAQPLEFEGIRQQDVFPLGLSAMWIDGAWNISNVRTQHEGVEGFNWAIAPIPRGPQWEQDRAYGWPDLLAIAPDTEYPDAAWDFIECMTGPLRTVDLSFPGKIPVYRSTAEVESWLELDMMPSNKDFLLEWAQNVGPTSFTPGWGEWRGYTDGAGMQGQLDEVFNGNQSLEDAIANINTYANEVLNRTAGEG